MPLKIIFSDPDFLAINKPAQLHCCEVGGGTSDSGQETLSQIIARELGCENHYFLTAKDAGLLQRLDYSSSGCILVAKNEKAQIAFKNLLHSEKFEKKYVVILDGIFDKNQSVDLPIGSPNRGAKKMRVYRHQTKKRDRALPAFSSFEPIAINTETKISLVMVQANVARRHQVRAHSAHLGFPLLGDALYGSKRVLSEVLPLARDFFLHADSLSFNHPFTGKKILLRAAPQEEEIRVINTLLPGARIL